MSNEIVRYAKKGLAKSDSSISNDFANAALAVGGGGLALYGVAALLPFVNLFMLMVVAVLFGAYLKLK